MASLKEYKRKRDFRQTPEPRGAGQPSPGGALYVVQKHAARRLHYDFRLEIGGVLKSWAVPKGPSLDPGEKRLAVHVEDHPVEYGSFEGTIPQGEYGGGTVMLWDRGTWEPLGSAHGGYRAGRLKFVLHGEKLRGAWMLVRMAGAKGENGKNWLLVKERDAEARPGSDSRILDEQPRSVATKRGMEAITSAGDAVWSSNRQENGAMSGSAKGEAATRGQARQGSPRTARRAGVSQQTASAAAKGRAQPTRSGPQATMSIDVAGLQNARHVVQPDKFSPQLATLVDTPPIEDDWLHEVKFDGYRMLGMLRDGQARLVSRNGRDWTPVFPQLAEALHASAVRDAIVDGEIVALNPDGSTSFQKLQNAIKDRGQVRLSYYLFDLPHCGGYDLTRTPLLERKRLLSELVAAFPPGGPLLYSDHTLGRGAEVFEHACQLKMEGIVSKRADSPYEQRRTRSWLKVKCTRRQEFVIGGYTDPEGARTAFGALLLGFYEGDELVFCGRVGTGFNERSLTQILAELKKLEQPGPAFRNPPRGREARGVHWVRPELVGEVAYAEMTSDGILRHPSFQGLRADKPAREVKFERATTEMGTAGSASAPGEGRPKMKSARAQQGATASGATMIGERDEFAGVKLSNPERVLYPEQKLTKRQLAEYYVAVADWVLPHIVGRPLSLVRCPRGHAEKCFFQKHVNDTTPEHIHPVQIREKDEVEEYIAISDLAGLISLVQMGVLEIHPWGSREDRVEQPDRITMDLDPGPDVPWSATIAAAVDLRDRLGELGLRSFVKNSGGKGLHVVLPIARRHDWETVKAFTKALAEDTARRSPGKYVTTMTKSKRTGKIFVDYLRNGRGATSVAAYSTRARGGAPVSTPLTWDELAASRSATEYTVANLPERLEQIGADPWAGFFDLKQSITAKMLKALGVK